MYTATVDRIPAGTRVDSSSMFFEGWAGLVRERKDVPVAIIRAEHLTPASGAHSPPGDLSPRMAGLVRVPHTTL